LRATDVHSSLTSHAMILPVGRKRQRHGDRAVAGEDADLDAALRADELRSSPMNCPWSAPICMPEVLHRRGFLVKLAQHRGSATEWSRMYW
jgi:hypothetical protein